MATTIPAGSRLLAEDLLPITDAVDNALSAWSTYTPAWTVSAGSVAIGNGSLTGRYKKIGRTVFLEIMWTWGSTTTIGTAGAFWSFGLPSGHVAAAQAQGTVQLLESGVSEYGGQCKLESGTSTVQMYKAVSGRILNNTPIATFSAGDLLSISLTYETTT